VTKTCASRRRHINNHTQTTALHLGTLHNGG
jgi:hypothetical protein